MSQLSKGVSRTNRKGLMRFGRRCSRMFKKESK